MLPDIQPGNTKILYFFNCLLDGMHTRKETLAGNKRTYICDFSRCGLNTRLYTLVSKPCSEATNIGSFIYCELSLAAEVKSEFILGRFEGHQDFVCSVWLASSANQDFCSWNFKCKMIKK